ncbi:uncharacterized protein LOC116013186 [Ipomoea triloba]|uniref:uncharacterized protein LOC116013186 n=1 Tax=Ipomoea triloba TaxID=35885 RepID=UPI00125E05D1|nr:uncharacterized protein LOC116013186 [Ipomoea triloba]
MTGNRFTWEKCRGTDAWVEERLDRVVANLDWTDLYSEASVLNILTATSNHCATFLNPVLNRLRASKRTFKFESAWLSEEGCKNIVDSSWQQSVSLHFQQHITLCGQNLWNWGGDYFRQLGSRIQHLNHLLKVLNKSRRPSVVSQFLQAENEFDGLLRQEEIFWKQRSKQLWLKHGDYNTKFFTILHPFDIIQPRVTESMNTQLLEPFTIDEVKATLFDMAPEKAPGLASFFLSTFLASCGTWPIYVYLKLPKYLYIS